MLRVAEMTGNLEQAIVLILAERRRRGRMREWVLGAVLYPLMVLVFLGGLVTGVFMFVVPKFKEIFSEFGAELPGITKTMVDGSSFYGAAPLVLILLLIVALVLLRIARRYGRLHLRAEQPPRQLLRRLAYLLPLARGNIRRKQLAELARELGMLIRVGTPAPRALRVVAEGTLHPVLRKRVGRAADLCERGEGLAAALDRAGLDPRLGWFARSLSSREGLADAMERLADDYEARIAWSSAVVLRLAPAMVVLLMGVFVGYTVVALFMPLISLMYITANMAP